jgi:hypothetical protein
MFYQTKNYVLPNKVICFTKQKTDFFIRRAKPKCQTKEKPTKNYVLPNKILTDLNLAYVFVKAVRPLNRKFESEEDYLNKKIIEEQKNTRE